MAGPDENWFVEAPGDIHRIEACLSGAAYVPHRHDTYTIAVTLRGIQSFAGTRGQRGLSDILCRRDRHASLATAEQWRRPGTAAPSLSATSMRASVLSMLA
ncbi:AraC family ligand binding domain-containing protein [Terricaulis sp.]|uniref:AraC family ligand binding domain-containing protein n=1 Tax=Terricaulis sp. TaxID=2768686 RepID=UPI003A0FD6AE